MAAKIENLLPVDSENRKRLGLGKFRMTSPSPPFKGDDLFKFPSRTEALLRYVTSICAISSWSLG